jgi:hypothetical protein
VAREPPLAGVDQVAETRRRAAIGADAQVPAPLGEMDPASGEIAIERRAKRAACEEAHGLGAQADLRRERRRPDTTARGIESSGPDLSPIPRRGDLPEDVLGLTDYGQEVENSAKEILDVFRADRA